MAKIMKIVEILSIVLSFCLLDISVKRLLKQPLHNHTYLFIKAHTKSRAFFNIQAGGGVEYAPTHVAFVHFFLLLFQIQV